MTDVKVEKKGNVAVVTIEHMQAMNALSTDMYAQLEEAFDTVGAMEDVYAVVLTGSSRVNKKGKLVQSFVAGADISQMSTMTVAEGKAFGNDSNRVCWKIENFKRPVIAAINGFCLGGGCELAMSCDIRLASANATFGQPEVGLGITPGFSGTQRMPRLIGMGKAKELIYTADIIDAAEAYRIGLVNHVYEPEALMEEAMKMAEKIASKAPIAVKNSKEAINRGIQTDMDSAVAIEAYLFGLCFASEDQKEGMTAFFEKRKANFQNK